jgi:hypothetical protein
VASNITGLLSYTDSGLAAGSYYYVVTAARRPAPPRRRTRRAPSPPGLGATTRNWIGRSRYPDPYFNGKIDDFRIYRGALSASAVAALMTA